MAPKPWKTLSSRQVYQNPWTGLREDIAEMPNGKTTVYGVVECGECAGVLPFLDERNVVLVRQYRYVFAENHRWETPQQLSENRLQTTLRGERTPVSHTSPPSVGNATDREVDQ